MTELDLDLEPNGDAFEAAYALPEDLEPDMRALHAEIITTLRNESRSVSVGMNVKMLIERMAWFYVAMKRREIYSADPMTFKEQKDMLDFWLKLHTEYNRLITSAEGKSRIALLTSVQDVLRDAMKMVEDPDKKYQIQVFLQDKFAELGV